MNKLKRIAAIHDISGFGKCSLTVALPILSAAGIEVCAIPTAVLSSHTGDLTGFTYRDLTDDMPGFAKQWKQLDLHFEALYSGFLGSYEQISIVSEIFDTFKTEDTFIMVDPVMADNGELYQTITPPMADSMANLCKKADLIVPNFTEAAFLLGEKYHEGPYTRDYVENLLRRLSGLGPQQVVITGVWFSPELVGTAGYCRDTDQVSYAFSQKIKGHYYGTGDIFASALLAGILDGMKLDIAMQIAVDFTAGCIRRTREAGTDARFGVNFEAGLLKFMRELGITE